MTETVPIHKTQSIVDEVNDVRGQIARRAHEIFSENGGIPGSDLDDWLRAERETVWTPAVELREKTGVFKLSLAFPEFYAKDVEVRVTADDILVKADLRNKAPEEEETVHIHEFVSGRMFRAIHLPRKINPDKVQAHLKNGMLTITAEISEGERTNATRLEAA